MVALLRGLLRAGLIAWGLLLLIPILGMRWREPAITGYWPWPDTPLTYAFLGSILAGIAYPIIWIGVSGELAALSAGALNLLLSCAAIAGFLLWWEPQDSIVAYLFGLGAAAAALLNLFIYLGSRNVEFRDPRPTPAPVRWSFLLLTGVLIAVGGLLLAQYPMVFPWPLKPQTSVIIGCIFLGAAVYFLHGFLVPLWANACGQLLGFLAYDLVLLMPFIAHFEKVQEERWLSLVVYTGVLLFSLTLAVFYLLLNPATWLWRAPPINGVRLD